MLLGYILLFLPLGYVVSTFLFLFGTSMYLGRGRPVRKVVYLLLFALIVCYVFTELLTVVLPAGLVFSETRLPVFSYSRKLVRQEDRRRAGAMIVPAQSIRILGGSSLV